MLGIVTVLQTMGVCLAILLAPGVILFFALMGELTDEADDD